MIETIWLGIFYLSGWHISTCLSQQYHYVADAKTWTDAQTYCRQTYTDLATIQSTDETNQLINTVSSAGYNSDFWIGLYSDVDWQWSDGYTGTGADYTNWDSGQPDFRDADQYCVQIYTDGTWNDYSCSDEEPFICYSGTQQDPQFVYVNEIMNMSSAQRYCRQNYIDLATVTNDDKNHMIQEMMPSDSWVWIGLFRNPDYFWSDQSSFIYSNFDSGTSQIGSAKVICTFTSVQNSGQWNFWACENVLPFVCYDAPPVVVTHENKNQSRAAPQRQVVKLRINVDPSLELNNLAVNEDLLKKLQDRLTEKGMSGVTLKWTEQSDGNIFHKEDP